MLTPTFDHIQYLTLPPSPNDHGENQFTAALHLRQPPDEVAPILLPSATINQLQVMISFTSVFVSTSQPRLNPKSPTSAAPQRLHLHVLHHHQYHRRRKARSLLHYSASSFLEKHHTNTLSQTTQWNCPCSPLTKSKKKVRPAIAVVTSVAHCYPSAMVAPLAKSVGSPSLLLWFAKRLLLCT